MDKKGAAEKNRWAFLPELMPKVATLIAEKRQTMGAAHVALCWQRGVVECLPGWFYAREGSLAVGTPWDGLELLYADTPATAQALVAMRPVATAQEAAHGAH